MKTKNLILLIILIVSIGFNVYSITTALEEVSPCDDASRYTDEVAGGGLEVAANDVKALVQTYQGVHKDEKSPYKTTGFVLSKKACDEIFKNATTNAIALDMFVENGQLNLSVRGTHTTKSGVDLKTGSNHFVIQTFCPSDCSAW